MTHVLWFVIGVILGWSACVTIVRARITRVNVLHPDGSLAGYRLRFGPVPCGYYRKDQYDLMTERWRKLGKVVAGRRTDV